MDYYYIIIDYNSADVIYELQMNTVNTIVMKSKSVHFF